jgi:hypothetical protein
MELVKDIRTLLLTKCSNVFFAEGSETKSYPRIVFDVRPYQTRRMVLEMDLWSMRENGNSQGEKELRDLADDLENMLDEMILSKATYIASFYTNNDVKPVPDENKDFKHINMSFDIIYQS